MNSYRRPSDLATMANQARQLERRANQLEQLYAKNIPQPFQPANQYYYPPPGPPYHAASAPYQYYPYPQ